MSTMGYFVLRGKVEGMGMGRGVGAGVEKQPRFGCGAMRWFMRLIADCAWHIFLYIVSETGWACKG